MSDQKRTDIRAHVSDATGAVAIGEGIHQLVQQLSRSSESVTYCHIASIQVFGTEQLIIACNGRIFVLLETGLVLFDDGHSIETDPRGRGWDVADVTGTTTFMIEFGDTYWMKVLKNGNFSIFNAESLNIYDSSQQ